MLDLKFYKDKKVFITGHTGFKGSWLCKILKNAGAIVTGFSLAPPTEPSLFQIANIANGMTSILGDIRDIDALIKVFNNAKPKIVFHLAAQPLVRESYENPRYTYETNVMGTINLLECLRQSNCVTSFVNITTDKVYLNNEWEWGYREYEPLDGFDPYSNSKSCSELATHCYRNSFFNGNTSVAISTARAGNVIGGGDFAMDRIIPDCVKAAVNKKDIIVRNPFSIRPYQHVLDPLYAYLLIAERQYEDKKYSDYYNIGPEESDCLTTGHLVDMFVSSWGEGLKWINQNDDGPHEAKFLKLDCSKIKARLGWVPRWNIRTAVEKTVEWTKCWTCGGDIETCMNRQITEFFQTTSSREYQP